MTRLDDAISKLKTVNFRLNDLEALLGKSIVQSVPTHLEVDFASQCNFRCLMCHHSKLNIIHSRLSSRQIDVLIDRLPEMETVMIAGLGEPLLDKRIEKFLPMLSKYHCQAHMFTNGELIDRRLDLLIHLSRISVSFDGATRQTFESLRVGSHFRKILSNVEKLRQHCPKTTIVFSTVLSRKNVGQVSGIVKHAIDLNVDEVHFSPVDHTPNLSLRAEDYPIFRAQIEEAKSTAALSNLKIFNNVRIVHFALGRNSKVSERDRTKAAKAKIVLPSENSRRVNDTAQPRKLIQYLSPEAELAELERRTDQLMRHLSHLGNEAKNLAMRPNIPRCTAPWKYSFARSTGGARLCPYADIDLGQVETVFYGTYNTPLLVDIRKSIVNDDPVLHVCRNCRDDHRNFRKESIKDTAKIYF